MQKRTFTTSNSQDVLAKPLLEVVVKEDLEYLLKVSCKDFAETIDFSKGYEIIPDAIPHLATEPDLPNAYSLFAKATLKTGKICRFVANTIWLGRNNYTVEIKLDYPKKTNAVALNQV